MYIDGIHIDVYRDMAKKYTEKVNHPPLRR